jgi:hypothetical protein
MSGMKARTDPREPADVPPTRDRGFVAERVGRMNAVLTLSAKRRELTDHVFCE